MLTLKKLQWSNCFSYGDNNEIVFDENPLTQLVGTNGAGKTSISLLLQEILYGKNIKNIKKQDITNNKSGKTGYSIVLYFEKDGIDYEIHLNRKSNLKLLLFKDGFDISSHTSLNTYKTINEIVGVADFKVFCQLIYQHSTDSLDFLTATDTNRKRFLISLLQLEKYVEMHERFKKMVTEVNKEVASLSGTIETLESWINRHKDMDLIKRDLIPVPPTPVNEYTEQKDIQTKLASINSINKRIVQNNQYISELERLDSKYYINPAPAAPNPSSNELRTQIRIKESEKQGVQKKLRHLESLPETCSQCFQKINIKINSEMVTAAKQHIAILDKDIDELNGLHKYALEAEGDRAKYVKAKNDFERLSSAIDKDLPLKTLDKNELTKRLEELSLQISEAEALIKSTEAENLKISAHNSKVDVIRNQLKEFSEDLRNKDVELIEKENLVNILELLKKTFGTNGLVSYKIESSVKELEKKINKYLSELSYFQIYFKLAGEKLNIEVVDDAGNVTSISNLSSGERARVNIATILAIRSILSSLTSTKINLLFLDEVIGVIDAEGKEKLAEVLLQENLNTFIVSHDWNHPLIPRINIIKEHNISRIEDG